MARMREMRKACKIIIYESEQKIELISLDVCGKIRLKLK